MKEVIEESVRLLERGEPCVLATVVRTKGMTPQKAGAKQLIRKDGTSLGTLGGGCVEGDILFYAKEILRRKEGPQFREYVLTADVAEKDGLVCGGSMYFFLEPFWKPEQFLPFANEIVNAYGGSPPITVATIVSSNKNKLGGKFLIRADGSTKGSLGDSKLEELAINTAKKIAGFGENKMIKADDGTEVYVEGFAPPPALVIMGGGHIGKSVYKLAVTLGFNLYIIDDRSEFSNKERFPEATGTIVADFDKGLDSIAINFNSFILVCTRGHKFDDTATQAAVKTPARYIGLLGSKRKNLLIFRELLKSGVSLERIKEIHAPVGLDIQARTPEELAVSIMAEIIMCIRGGDGKSLKKDNGKMLEEIQKLPKDAQKIPC